MGQEDIQVQVMPGRARVRREDATTVWEVKEKMKRKREHEQYTPMGRSNGKWNKVQLSSNLGVFCSAMHTDIFRKKRERILCTGRK